jgi:hypothetical protein
LDFFLRYLAVIPWPKFLAQNAASFARVRGTPDVLTVTLGVTSRGKSVGEALDRNNAAARKVITDAGWPCNRPFALHSSQHSSHMKHWQSLHHRSR